MLDEGLGGERRVAPIEFSDVFFGGVFALGRGQFFEMCNVVANLALGELGGDLHVVIAGAAGNFAGQATARARRNPAVDHGGADLVEEEPDADGVDGQTGSSGEVIGVEVVDLMEEVVEILGFRGSHNN